MNYPKYLYKFYPLFDDEKLSAERLKVFKDKFFWMSSNDRLNDPTEFEYYYNDQSDMYRMLTYHLTHNHLITCFSKKLYNLPMWSHYANNHKGFCVKFLVYPEAVNLYKVNYVSKAKTLSEIMNEEKGYKESVKCSEILSNTIKKNELSSENNKILIDNLKIAMSELPFTYMKRILSMKNTDWRYEQEYRIILPEGMEFLKEENLLPFEYSFLDPVQIFVGIDCDEKYEKILEEISKEWEIEKPYRMKIADFY